MYVVVHFLGLLDALGGLVDNVGVKTLLFITQVAGENTSLEWWFWILKYLAERLLRVVLDGSTVHGDRARKWSLQHGKYRKRKLSISPYLENNFFKRLGFFKIVAIHVREKSEDHTGKVADEQGTVQEFFVILVDHLLDFLFLLLLLLFLFSGLLHLGLLTLFWWAIAWKEQDHTLSLLFFSLSLSSSVDSTTILFFLDAGFSLERVAIDEQVDTVSFLVFRLFSLLLLVFQNQSFCGCSIDE